MTGPSRLQGPVDLSVVIASIDSTRSLAACLRHMTRACEGVTSEIIVVDASAGNAADQVRAVCGPATLIPRPAGTLAPHLWATGLAQSSGRVVAFTTSHCLVSPRWAGALLRAIDEGATGAGGPVAIGEGSSPLDWAVFYLRYAGFMPHAMSAGRTHRDVAGDNAAYRRDSLDRHAASFASGFWEVDFHRLVRADDGWLSVAPEALVEFGRSFSPGTILRQRFSHGQHSGARQVSGGMRPAWQVVMAAPVLPLVLAARAATHAAGGPAPWRLLVALPWFLSLATAWAAGEAVGAWGAGQGPSPPEPQP